MSRCPARVQVEDERAAIDPPDVLFGSEFETPAYQRGS
jgi:hypothetical protein